MDSTGLLVHLLARGCKVYGISFNYGQKHKLELDRLEANLAYLSSQGHDISHKIVDISVLGSLYNSSLTTEGWDIPEGHYEQDTMKQTVVPNRNAIFSSIAYGYALSMANKTEEDISLCLGVHSGDHAIYPDCRPEFYGALENAFQIGNYSSEKVSFYLPYIGGNKETILKDAEKSLDRLGLDFNTVFANTNTSYDPDDMGRSSGKSGADVERILAFHAVGRADPVPYVKPWPEVLQDAINTEKRYKEKI